MKKKIIVIFSVFFLVLFSFLISKYIYFKLQESIYYSSTISDYDSVSDYIKQKPKLREINENYKGKSLNTYLLNLSLSLPFDKKKDSIELKHEDKALIGGLLNKDKKTTKSILFIVNDIRISSGIKKEIKKIESKVDTINTFDVYNHIYSYTPKMNLIYDNYNQIKYNLRLSYLKSILMINGGEKVIYKFKNNKFKGFQFCEPKLCRTITLSLFVMHQEILMTFKNFTQDEIDFVLNSIAHRK